jgi:NifU-like protein involved in Fe-S cluster formation
MNADPYSAHVRALFAAPAHVGTLPAPYSVFVDQPGVRIELSATPGNGVLEKLRFRAWGCPHFIAAAEWFCAQFEGKPVATIESFAAAELMQSLAVPVAKSGRILVLEDAVRMLGAAIRATSTIAVQAAEQAE